MPSAKQLCAQLTARALIAARRPRDIGCLAEDLPPFDPEVLASELVAHSAQPVRLALLGYPRARDLSRGGLEFSTSETTANTWRNDSIATQGTPLFVVAQGSVSKLKSLQSSLTTITDRQVRDLLAEEAIGWFETPARRAFWTQLRRNTDAFSITALLEYAAAASEVMRKSNRVDLSDSEASNLHLLGLVPDRRFWQSAGEKRIAATLAKNADVSERLRLLTRNDRRLVAEVAEAEDGLSATAQRMLAYHRTKKLDVLKGLEFGEVAQVLTPKKKRRAGGEGEPLGGVKKPRPMKADEAGFRDVIEADGSHLRDIAIAVRDAEDSEDEESAKVPRPVEIDGRQVIPKPMSGSALATSLFQRLATTDVFGGVVRADGAPDAVGCIKMFEASEASVTEFRPADATRPGAVQALLEKAVAVFGMSTSAVEAWRSFLTARARLMRVRDDLVACPLVTLLDQETLQDAEAVVTAYAGLMNEVQRVRDEIGRESADSARDVVSGALALDVVMLQYRNGRVALAGPLHPFHLWRYTQIARIVQQHREDLRTLDDEQISQFTEPVVSSPHLVVSNHLDHSLERPAVFVGAGSLGYLPLYADPDGRVATQLRASGLGKIVDKFLRAAGYAQFGLDVVFVDPPSLADVLDAVLSVNRRRTREDRVPIHVRVVRTRPSPSSTDEEEDEMEELAEALRDCAGTLDVDSEPRPVTAIASYLEQHKAHYTVFFEPGEASSFRIGADAMPRRSPLLLPRHYRYDRMKDRFTVHVSGDGEAFGAYYGLFYDLLQVPRDAAIGRRSGAQQWVPELARIATHTMWFSVIDQDIEPTFAIDGAVCLGREVVADRDLLTFTSHEELLDRSLHHLIAEAGLPATDATRTRAHQLFRRLGGNLLSDVVGRAAAQQCVGLVGVLGVVEWHERNVDNAVLASLDSAAARAWILGAIEGDNRRGDLVCLRQTKLGLRLDVIEVKTREDERAVLHVASGKTIAGAAAEQVDNTIRALRRIMRVDADVLDSTRREVLKDQLYQAVASQEMTPTQRQRSVAMLEEFFRDGPGEIGGRVFLVHLEPSAAFKAERVGRGDERSPADNPIEAFRVTFGEIEDDGTGVLPAVIEEGGASSSPPASGPAMEAGRGASRTSEMPPGAATRPSGVADDLAAEQEVGYAVELLGAESPADVAPSVPDGVCVVLGADPLGKPITWDTTANPAFGVLVTGDTGFGKTQTLRVIVAEVRAAGLPVLIFDYKPDYADEAFVSAHDLTVYDVKRRGLPFNPLALMPDKNGEVYPYDQIYELAEIFRRVLDLGEQQENRLVEAQASAYRAHGWDPQKYTSFETTRRFPSFAEVMSALDSMEKDKVAKTTYTRLKKFLDMNLFPAQSSDEAFDALMSKSVVLAMNELPKELANTLSEVLIVKLHGTLRRGGQPRKIQRMLVFDEAWRVSGSSKLTELAREGRAFGVGLAIGTQNPSDMPQELVSCLRTQVFLCNKDPDSQKAIARVICGQASGREAQRIIEQVKNLGKFQGIIISEQYKDGRRVNILPYSERRYPSEA